MEPRLTRERRLALEWVKKNLVGPAFSQDEEIKERPSLRYSCGILFPQRDYSEMADPMNTEIPGEMDDRELVDGTGEDRGLKKEGRESRKHYYTPPSAASLSFLVSRDSELEIVVAGAFYRVRKVKKWTWQRSPFPEIFLTIGPDDSAVSQPIWDERACVYSLWRPCEHGFIVTVSLANLQRESGPFPESWEEACLFQVGMDIVPVKGRIKPYPRMDETGADDEDREIEVQYSRHGVYAVGHGAAADWTLKPGGGVQALRLEFLPGYEVPIVTSDIDGLNDRVLGMNHLAEVEDNPSSVWADLEEFIGRYDAWITERNREAQELQGEEFKAGIRILDRCRGARNRMLEGLKRLRTDDRAVKAFAVTNRAVARQMKGTSPQWRPFQLGFFLSNLETLTNEDAEDRDVVDLLWFPTGGGKTEAYLALIAFLICYRRLRYPDKGGGTAVIMRYTLRLLTAQQFVRAAGLICSLELFRREEKSDLGREPITLGLWVGEGTVPNTFEKANEYLEELRKRGPARAEKLVLLKCPVPGCGADLLVPGLEETGPRGLEWSRSHLRFVCPNPHCELNITGSKDGVIPVHVIDQHLYRNPPSLLLSTVDKFALLAWKSEPNAFFGHKGNRPPELIIQDELHLISGELGTIYGLYEAAFDTVIGLKGVRPKYIASTATIRHAAWQVRQLYGRGVLVFPPPGLDIDDSFFARAAPITPERPGRLYVGYLAPGVRRDQALGQLSAVLLTAPCTRGDVEVRDAWWTLLIYHGSLKGVGNSKNIMRNMVPDFMERIREEINEQVSDAPDLVDPWNLRELVGERVAELTSNIGPGKIPTILERMDVPWDHPESIDVLLCTNMISVGIDVDRLALMVVNGQPLTTGEYIQASSRVGRKDVPGLVVAHYFRHQARSLSHFENFRAYHESFYRFVEPTSVTPFSIQARQRALHAALIIVMRQAVPGLLAETAAGAFDPDHDLVKTARDKFWKRCKMSDPEAALNIREELDAILSWWDHRAREAARQHRQLAYSDSDRTRLRLIRRFEGSEDVHSKATLMSMRHVDEDCGLKIFASKMSR